MESFQKFCESRGYRLLICCVILPINGYIMTHNFILGALLTVMQIPYLLSQFK